MFGLFKKKREVEDLREDIQESFNHVKRDFNKVGDWIKHLDDKHGVHKEELDTLKDQLLTIHQDLAEIKDFISFFGPQLTAKASKQTPTASNKQTNTIDVQTPVQTSVQTDKTDILDNLTVMERAIIWSLLNADINLSYEDLAALLGKEKSTIRGQINSIKQKTEGLVEEIREPTGKKRLYIPEKIREEVIKSVKVRVKKSKKRQKIIKKAQKQEK